MAKQIYIDENGNPIEVSGTVNTAELLPISGNDPTDTKNYIDTGLSGKADKTEIPTLLTNDSYSIVSLKLYGTSALTGNLNTLLTDGIYQVGNITAQANAPTGIGYSGCVKVLHITSGYLLQEAICDSGRRTRLSFDGGSTWNAWY